MLPVWLFQRKRKQGVQNNNKQETGGGGDDCAAKGPRKHQPRTSAVPLGMRSSDYEMLTSVCKTDGAARVCVEFSG
jgi:hypothetical protein